MSPTLRVALCQTDIAWQDVDANLSRLSPKLAALPSACDLVVLPEMFATGFTMEPDALPADTGRRVEAWLRATASELGAAVCGSTPYRLPSDRWVNRFICAWPSGKTEHYDKRHRFAMAGEREAYAPGSASPVIVTVAGWRLLLQVCYDLRFPVFSRNRDIRAGAYDAVVYVANWPAPRRTHWQVLAKARAIENQAYCVAVNRVGQDPNGNRYLGDSAAYGPQGELVVGCAVGEPDVALVSLRADRLEDTRSTLPFLRDADRFVLHD